MQVSEKQIAFKSKINFVDKATFDKIAKGKYISPITKKDHISISKEFYTDEIRTCTAGGIVEPYKHILGFHIFDCQKTMNIIKEILAEILINSINKKGLLIGGKENISMSEFSIPIYRTIRKNLQNKLKDLSLFEIHANQNAQSHCHYSTNTDTWTICTEYRDKINLLNWKQLDTPEELSKIFKRIHIAKTDELYFHGNKIEKLAK